MAGSRTGWVPRRSGGDAWAVPGDAVRAPLHSPDWPGAHRCAGDEVEAGARTPSGPSSQSRFAAGRGRN